MSVPAITNNNNSTILQVSLNDIIFGENLAQIETAIINTNDRQELIDALAYLCRYPQACHFPIEVCQKLLEKGVSPSALASTGTNVVLILCSLIDNDNRYKCADVRVKILGMFVNALTSDELNVENDTGSTALDLLDIRGEFRNPDAIKILESKGAKRHHVAWQRLDEQSQTGSPISLATASSRTFTFKRADLLAVCFQGKVEEVKNRLNDSEQILDTNEISKAFLTTCYVVNRAQHIEVLQLLSDRGANPNFINNSGETPLYALLKTMRSDNYGIRLQVVASLVKRGADPNFIDRTNLSDEAIEALDYALVLFQSNTNDIKVETSQTAVSLQAQPLLVCCCKTDESQAVFVCGTGPMMSKGSRLIPLRQYERNIWVLEDSSEHFDPYHVKLVIAKIGATLPSEQIKASESYPIKKGETQTINFNP